MPFSPARAAVAALFLASVYPAFAQQATPAGPAASVPRVVRVDGAFAPGDGLPPAAVETVTLSLYASDTDATPLFEETQEVRVDALGRYALFLGGTSTEGLPVALFAAGESRWLGVRFARPGETEQPRVLLTSVPYALRASDADTLGGLPPSAFLRSAATAGASGIDGDVSTDTRTVVPAISTGTANYIGKFTNAVDLTSSALFDSAGRIGLGTTTPLDFLHARFSDTTGSFTGYAVQNLGSGASSYSGMLFYDQNGALGQFQGFNNTTHEYRINNIASGGSINFMIGGASRFQVRNDGDINITGAVRRNGQPILQANTGGSDNNVLLGAFGPALGSLTSVDNTGIGNATLNALIGGGGNVALGSQALRSVVSTNFNVAVGVYALQQATGDNNIALGAYSGNGKVTGNNNMYLGYGVATGAANTESSTVRIGDSGLYNRFFTGGVRGITTGVANAVAVVVDSNGQLGTINSSRRYKEDIQDMGDASSALMKLRPVTYRYTQAFANGAKPIDYGLIAEEVEEVYPDLVAHLKNGEVETVQYHKINAMLLNEVQKQHREITDLKARLEALERLLTSDRK